MKFAKDNVKFYMIYNIKFYLIWLSVIKKNFWNCLLAKCANVKEKDIGLYFT